MIVLFCRRPVISKWIVGDQFFAGPIIRQWIIGKLGVIYIWFVG
ncbi:hypothetical protein [Corynebacterium halotolerans]